MVDYFLDASGSTGKNFIANLSKVRQSGRKALAVASSAIAANLLNDVKAAHLTFRLQLAVSLEQSL